MPNTATEAGLEALRSGDPRAAIDHLLTALRADGPDPEVLGYLGVAHGLLNEPAQAIRFLREACELAPHSAPLHANLGRALAAAGKTEEAVGAYRSALNADPGYERARIALLALTSRDPLDRTLEIPAASLGIASRNGHAPQPRRPAPPNPESEETAGRSGIREAVITLGVGTLIMVGCAGLYRADLSKARAAHATVSAAESRPLVGPPYEARRVRDDTLILPSIPLPPERSRLTRAERRMRRGIAREEGRARDCLRLQEKYEAEGRSPSAKPEDEWLRTAMLDQIRKSFVEARNRRNRICYELADLYVQQRRPAEALQLLEGVLQAQPAPNLAEEVQARLKELRPAP